jgi:hypothetical protein
VIAQGTWTWANLAADERVDLFLKLICYRFLVLRP